MIINMNGAKAPETPSPVLQEKTITPETLPTVIGADEGYDGLSQVTVNPDAQLKAENIRSGKTIFGVTGAFVGEPVYEPVSEIYQYFLLNYNGMSTPSIDCTVTNKVVGEFGSAAPRSYDKFDAKGIVSLMNRRYTYIASTDFSGSRMDYGYPVTVTADEMQVKKFYCRVYNWQDVTYSTGSSVSLDFYGLPYCYSTSATYLGTGNKEPNNVVHYELTGKLQRTMEANSDPNTCVFDIALDNPIVLNNLSLTGMFTSNNVDPKYISLNFAITKLSAVIE